ncbi:hypothetical protein C8J57DRAFT_1112769 [Mycena rebaudengoi]|nr:hypothetical protein C8J57DRAFT_1112769 [Mycena rebaudengoi]
MSEVPVLTRINHTRGRALRDQDTVWYSPNPTSLQPSIPQTLQFSSQTRLHKLQVPLHWNADHKWLPFVPLHNPFSFHPAEVLQFHPIVSVTGPQGGFQLAPHILRQWMDLEKILSHLIGNLTVHHSASAGQTVAPVEPSATGYQCVHTKERYAQTQCMLAQEKFILNLALLSYLMSLEPLSAGIPQWFEVGKQAGVSEAILSSMRTSWLCDYTPNVQRAGVFHRIFPPENKPGPKFYIDHGIPTWYIWGPAELTKSEGIPGKLQYAPPDALLRSIHKPSAQGENSEYPWVSFFSWRERSRPDIAGGLWAGVAKLRELNPPTSAGAGTKVFRWVERAGKRVRMAVPAQWIADALNHYRETQKKYDAQANEWDVCTLFDEDELHASLEEEEPLMGKDEIECLPKGSMTEEREQDPIEPPTFGFRGAIEEILSERYGFTMPPTDMPSPSSGAWKLLGNILGVAEENVHPRGAALVDFVESCTLTGKPFHIQRCPDSHLWDLDTSNPHALPLKDLLESSVRVISGVPTCFSFGVDGQQWQEEGVEMKTIYEMVPQESAPWALSFTSALSLVHAVRLTQNKGMALEALVGHLFQYGIPFTLHTKLPRLHPLPPVRSVQAAEFGIPIRSVGYRYKVSDYVAYESFAVRLLNEPHGQAALLMGGIVWRIAVDVLGLDHVLAGPSSSVTERYMGTCLEDRWDDMLSPVEADMICGLHAQDTGNVSKDGVHSFAMVSWWPTHEAWNSASCGKNPGFWSPACEAWFQQRRRDIRSGEVQPIKSEAWRDKLKGIKKARDLVVHGELSALARIKGVSD